MEGSVGSTALFPAPHPTESSLHSSPAGYCRDSIAMCWVALSHSDGLDRTILFADLPSVQCLNLGTRGLKFTRSVCCASRARPATRTQRAMRPILKICWRGISAGSNLRSSFQLRSSAPPEEHVEDPRMHLWGLGILSTLGQA